MPIHRAVYSSSLPNPVAALTPPATHATPPHRSHVTLPARHAGFRTQFQGYSVRFSPFEETKLAVATSQNFGIVGNGRQYVLQVGKRRGCPLLEGRQRCCAGRG
jgi:hypothetical protein